MFGMKDKLINKLRDKMIDKQYQELSDNIWENPVAVTVEELERLFDMIETQFKSILSIPPEEAGFNKVWECKKKIQIVKECHIHDDMEYEEVEEVRGEMQNILDLFMGDVE